MEGEFILQMCSFLVSKNVMPLQKNIPKLSNKETLKAKSLETVFERYPPILAVSQNCHIWNQLEESPLWRSSQFAGQIDSSGTHKEYVCIYVIDK